MNVPGRLGYDCKDAEGRVTQEQLPRFFSVAKKRNPKIHLKCRFTLYRAKSTLDGQVSLEAGAGCDLRLIS